MPHFSSSPQAMLHSIFTNRALILMLIKREILSRYRGSIMGVIWSIILPLSMLTIYTFVYSSIFKSKWLAEGEAPVTFALILFIGILLFSLFSECMNRAATLIVSQASYVKKVIFPVEILPCVILGASLFQLGIGFFLWLFFYCIIIGLPPATLFYFPLLLIPYTALILGLCWFFSALGVYLRDMGHAMNVIVMISMFITPIFYPLAAVPERYRPYFYLNPLVFFVEQTRNILIWGRAPSLASLVGITVIGFAGAWLGFICFQKTRKGFADVI